MAFFSAKTLPKQVGKTKKAAVVSDIADTIKKKMAEEHRLAKPIPTDPKVDAAAIERIITARISLLLNKPFFGNLATRLILRNSDEWLPTAATDGKFFYYNSEFIMKLTESEVIFLVGHEVLHVVYDHMGRRNDRHPKLWNIANDFCVNWDLVEENIGTKITTVPILYDAKYKGLSSEEVYADIMEEVEKQQKDKGKGGEGSEGGEGGSGSDNDTRFDKWIDKVLDEHMDDSKDGSKDGSKGPVSMTTEERKAMKDEIKEAVLQAAEAVGAGNVPGGVKRLIKDLVEPKINWRELIAQQIESTIKADYSWMRPSRRSWHMDAVMPGMMPGQTIDVCVAIDTSGSISGSMLIEFLSEVQGIMEQYEDFKVHVWCFDTGTHNPQVFSSDNMADIAEYEPAGFGGTDFEVNWEWMKEEGIEPKKLIVFTDGYPYGSWGDPDYCETVWIIHGNKEADPPFGIWAHYEETM